ncbi:MAG: response regulator transcription factor [Thiohalomonadales bacterium]
MRILIVEDEQKLAQSLAQGLRNEGHQVDVSYTGEEGFFLATDADYDLILLDIMLPQRSGLEILEKLRSQGNNVPVLILSAKDTLADRVMGLNQGADDYLVKPFAFSELIARINAVTRRGGTEALVVLEYLELHLDLLTRSVTRAGTTIDLTRREFDLLEYVLRHQGHIVSRAMLAKDVWQQPNRATPLDNVIDVHITRLRQKLDAQFAYPLIHTIRGVGFVLERRDP